MKDQPHIGRKRPYLYDSSEEFWTISIMMIQEFNLYKKFIHYIYIVFVNSTINMIKVMANHVPAAAVRHG